jgi:hypothetical protein
MKCPCAEVLMPGFHQKTLAVFLSILCGVAAAHAQSGQPQTGYVIVTPIVGDPSRLTAFQTFRFTGGAAPTQASIVDSTLTTNSSVFVTSDISTGRDFGIAICNPGDIVATVNLTLYRANGSILDTDQIQIQPEQQIALYLTQLFPSVPELRAGFTGLLNLISSNAIGIVGLRFQDHDFSPVPVTHNLPLVPTVPPHLNGAGGPGAVLLPQFVMGGGWKSEVVLTNTSIGGMTVRVDFFSSMGGPLTVPLTTGAASTVTGITIPPNGVVVLGTTY